jgi:hypothetical protein
MRPRSVTMRDVTPEHLLRMGWEEFSDFICDNLARDARSSGGQGTHADAWAVLCDPQVIARTYASLADRARSGAEGIARRQARADNGERQARQEIAGGKQQNAEAFVSRVRERLTQVTAAARQLGVPLASWQDDHNRALATSLVVAALRLDAADEEGCGDEFSDAFDALLNLAESARLAEPDGTLTPVTGPAAAMQAA